MLLDRKRQVFFNGYSIRLLEHFSKIREQELSSELIQTCKEKIKSSKEAEIYEKIIKDEYERIDKGSGQSSPMKVDPTQVKQEQLSPMKVDIEITYEEIIKDEYKKITMKQESPSSVEQGQHLTDSEKSKEEDIEIVKVIKPSCVRMLEWFEQHVHFFSGSSGDVLHGDNFLRWTEDLAIDKKSTAESLIVKKLLSVEEEYKLACLYCLEDFVGELWGRLTKEQKDKYSKSESNDVLMEFWASKMEGEKKKGWIEENYEYLLESIVKDGNEVTLEYFLDYLGQLELKPDLLSLAVTAVSISSSEYSYTHHTPVLCKLLDKMNDGDKHELYKTHHCCVLSHLVGLQQYQEVSNLILIWEWGVPWPVCEVLLANIANKVVEGNSNDQETFVNLWNKVGKEYNKCNRVGKQLLPYLFQFDAESIKNILSNATDDEKKEIANYAIGYKNWSPKNYNLDSLLVIVNKCLNTEKENREFMENVVFSGDGFEVYTRLVIGGKLDQFEDLRNKFWNKEINFNGFKNRFFQSRGADIFTSLCMKDKKALFDGFLKWYFPSQNNTNTRISEFKKKLVLAHRSIEAVINAVSERNMHYGWKQYQEEFIKWSDLRESEFEACLRKEEHGNVRKLYVYLLLEQKVELVDEFLSWCFPGNEKKVDEFKQDFASGEKAVNFCTDKIKAGGKRAVKNFLKWVKLPEEGREDFRQKCDDRLKGKYKETLEELFKEVYGSSMADSQSSERKEKRRKRKSDGNTQEPKEKSLKQSDSPESSMQEVAEVEAICQSKLESL